MAEAAAWRHEPLSRSGWSIPGLAYAPLPPASRHVLRLPADAVAAASEALGLELPALPCRSSRAGSRAALWLGPDEWLLLDDDTEAPAPALPGIGSLVDVSHSNVGAMLGGPQAEAVLAHGCPLDLHPSAFPIGKCTRTVLGKVEIVLWREDEYSFRIEFGRSFADYVNSFIALVARGLSR